MSVDNSRLIDLDRALATKFKGKKVPRVLSALLKAVIRQKTMNRYVARTTGDGSEFCAQIIEELGIKLEIVGLENVPKGNKYCFVSNHPLGGVDGMALCGMIGRNFGPMKTLSNDFISFIPPMKSLAIPINKVGGQSRELPRLLEEAFGSEDQLLVFPAGLCSRRIKGEIKDLTWTKTFIAKSISSGRAVVPIHFIGRNSSCFYFVANLCKWLKLKFNFAMVMLPSEMVRARGRSYKIVIGKPIPASTFDKTRSNSEWAAWVRDKVYSL